MSVADFAANDLFVIRIVKSLYANPDNRWANTYEAKATEAGGANVLLELAVALKEFEILLHSPGVQFRQLTVSTWSEDSVPYNPAAFLSFALNEPGTRTLTGGPLALNKTLSVARVVTTGRLGHVFYRGSLGEGDVEAPAGTDILTNAPAMVTQVAASVTAAELEPYFVGGDGSLQLVMVTKSGDNIRPIVNFFPVGVSSVPTDHAWYNRTGLP